VAETTDPFTSAKPPAENTREKAAKRDGLGRYLIPKLPGLITEPTPAKGDTSWTRATTFAKSISDTYTLSQWSQRMVAKGLASRADLVLGAAACPISDKGTLDSIVEQAKDAAATRASANLGTAMHAFTEAADRGEQPEVPAPYDRDLDAYLALIAEHDIQVLPDYIERSVVNGKFNIAGTFDRIVMWKGQPTVLDLKTGRDLQYGWNEIGIQLAIYANASAIWDWDAGQFLPMPSELRKDRALVIHLPVGKGEASLYEVQLEAAWAACQLCQDVRKWRSERKLAALVSVAGGEPVATPQMKADAAKAQERRVAAGLEPSADRELESSVVSGLGSPEHASEQAAKGLDPFGQSLAPLAKAGERGCSVCHRKGHRANSVKCLGKDDPALEPAAGFTIEESRANFAPSRPATVCAHGAWTRNPVTGLWECGTCGGPAAAELQTELTEAQATPVATPALGTERVTEDEEVADPFADEPIPAPKAKVRPPTWEERLNTASSKAEIRDIRAEALEAGAWTKALQAVGIARLGKISEPAG
jgi:hypothetical protein